MLIKNPAYGSQITFEKYAYIYLSDSFLTLIIYLEIVPLEFSEPCQPLCS